MALNLSAEQKSLRSLFTGHERYIIPSYQRPYSWNEDETIQLWDDILNAFNEDLENEKLNNEYFIGHMIVAKNDKNEDELEVIDGQQRLSTLTLLLKIYSLFDVDNKVLFNALWVQDWRTDSKIQRLESKIFETKDNDSLLNVLTMQINDFNSAYHSCLDKQKKLDKRKCNNKYLFNSLLLYGRVKDYQEKRNLTTLVDYTMKKVFILPIQMGGNDILEARENALKIFETINNRGKNLADADIFKAHLYNQASSKREEELFINLWKQFREDCDYLQITIDDVFRFYSHIIRGKEGIDKPEIALREFFTQKEFSPLKLKNHQEVISDLFRILEILIYFNKVIEDHTHECYKWFHLIAIYSNQYPKTALIVYLFHNGLDTTDNLLKFLQSIIRYAYYMGATSNVKFEFHNIIVKISQNKVISEYFKTNVSLKYFDYLGALKKGYSLLGFYLEHNTFSKNIYIDKIINYKDKDQLDSSWDDVRLFDVVDTLGNYVVLDIQPKNIQYKKKANYFMQSQYDGVVQLADELEEWTYEKYIQRNDRIKKVLIDFFQGQE